MKAKDEIDAMAFINLAIEYKSAADQLYALRHDRPGMGSEPVYFLYFHSIELALKGHLRTLGWPTPRLKEKMRHQVNKLLTECNLPLTRDTEIHRSIRSVLSLLECANGSETLRYFDLKSRGLPDLDWTREVADVVLRLARTYVVGMDDPHAEVPGVAMKLDMIVSKPVRRSDRA